MIFFKQYSVANASIVSIISIAIVDLPLAVSPAMPMAQALVNCPEINNAILCIAVWDTFLKIELDALNSSLNKFVSFFSRTFRIGVLPILVVDAIGLDIGAVLYSLKTVFCNFEFLCFSYFNII